MALDPMTGLDPEKVALRATEGLFGVDYFFPVRPARDRPLHGHCAGSRRLAHCLRIHVV